MTLAPPKAYTPHAAGGAIDDYHCFVLDPHLKQDMFVTGALIKPQRTGIVHHVILYEAAGAQAAVGDAAERGARRQGLDVLRRPEPAARPLVAGRDRPARTAAVDRGVGARAHDERAAGRDTGVLLHTGAQIVMQVHYNLIEAAGPDRSQAQLRLRPATTKLTPLADAADRRARRAAVPGRRHAGRSARARRRSRTRSTKYGVENAYIPTALLQICGKTLADYPQEVGTGTSICTSCDRAVSAPETIYGVAGHMHLRGQRHHGRRSTRARAKEQTLLHIPAWDFHWQDVYYLDAPGRSRPGRHDPRQVHVRQLEGRPAGRRREAADAALRPVGRRHDRRDVPRHALGPPPPALTRFLRDATPAERRRGSPRAVSRTRSLTTRGSALPPVSFITWPTKKPSRPCLPLRYCSAWPGFAAMIRSITGSSSDASATTFCSRYGAAVKPGSPTSRAPRRTRRAGSPRAPATSFASSPASTASGDEPVATNWFASTFAASFGSAPGVDDADQSRSRPPVTRTSAS